MARNRGRSWPFPYTCTCPRVTWQAVETNNTKKDTRADLAAVNEENAGACADYNFHPKVSSFLSTWSIRNIGSSPHPPPHSPEPSADAPPSPDAALPLKQDPASATQVSSSGNLQDSSNTPSPTPQRTRAASGRSRSSSRPASMVQTYQPPLMEVANDTPPELQPIFTFLNSHSNKLYQEGYFLKLHDLDTKGKPSKDRAWQECFAVRFPENYARERK